MKDSMKNKMMPASQREKKRHNLQPFPFSKNSSGFLFPQIVIWRSLLQKQASCSPDELPPLFTTPSTTTTICGVSLHLHANAL